MILVLIFVFVAIVITGAYLEFLFEKNEWTDNIGDLFKKIFDRKNKE